MQVVAWLSQKGGTGKTTSCVNVAVSLVQAGVNCVIFDLDPQGSARDWQQGRPEPYPEVIPATAHQLPRLLEVEERTEIPLAFLDTPPHAEASALVAARSADLVMIPCRPSLLDLRAIRTSLAVCDLARRPRVALLTMTTARSRLSDQARQALADLHLAVCPQTLGQRLAFVHAMTESRGVTEHQPRSQAATETERLRIWLQTQLANLGPKEKR